MIYGNYKQQSFLKEALENKESAILIVGPEGVGKFSFAFEYLNGKDWEKIILDSSSKNFKIDSARLVVSLAYKKSQRRIILINDFHKFQPQSQNVLLKTLEESKTPTTFIFITHKENKILPTIRSRSLKIKFNLVESKETASFLKNKNFKEDEINFALDFYPHQPGKAFNFLSNKEKLNIFKKIITGKEDVFEEVKNVFTLNEFLEYYLLFLRKKALASLKNKIELKEYILKLRQATWLFYDSDYNLNLELQIANLILNNG
jgi:DNA polymerase III delta prime subunit